MGGAVSSRVARIALWGCLVRVLGLDPSLSSFGWAVYDTEAVGKDRCPARGVFKTSPRQLFVDRYNYLRGQVAKLVSDQKPDKVGLESSVFNAHQSEAMYALFTNTCEALKDTKCDVVFLTPPQVKAHARLFLGRPQKPKWKMEKADMMEAARVDTGGKGRWGNDEADAYWVARISSRFWQFMAGDILETDLDVEEEKHFTYTHTYTRGKRAGQTIKQGLVYRNGDRYYIWSGDKNYGKERS